MGLTKQYLRFEESAIFGVIASPGSNVLFLNIRGTIGRFIATAACENVAIWDTRTNEKVFILHGEKHNVTVISCRPDHQQLAVGYSDGAIRIFDVNTTECIATFTGHKAGISCLSYDSTGMKLVSGGKDTDIVIWDIVSEAGMFRLKGHKGIITSCCFMKTKNILVSSSKDSFIKFWDLDTQHCFKTLTGLRSEVWDFVMFADDSKLIIPFEEKNLGVWNLHYKLDENQDVEKNVDLEPASKDEETDEDSPVFCSKAETLLTSTNKIRFITKDESETIFGCIASDKEIKLYKHLTPKEIQKMIHKEQKKKKGKEIVTKDEESAITISEFRNLPSIWTSHKIKAFDIVLIKDTAKVLVLLSNNCVMLYTLNFHKSSNVQQAGGITSPGHRSDVRSLDFSSDNLNIISSSADCIKIWNRASQQCTKTMICGYAICTAFVPGDKHCIIGTKSGQLQIFSISSGDLLDTIEAHSASIWSLSVFPDMSGLATGSEDQDVKFWNFELCKDNENSEARLSVVHSRTLKVSEGILCVKYSPNSKFLAASLLDSTVKIFFSDTLKFFVSLYGHKFPVLCMDISSDSTLIVTGSADRNIKIWGLDFGDCHKSIFAHEDSIMCLQFIPNTHMFFSGSKDKKLKQWDADNFQKVTTLEGHQSEIWSLAVSSDGRHVVTSSHDKSLRLWSKTEEVLVLQEEEEKELEAAYEKTDANHEEPVLPGEANKETGLAGRKTLETIKYSEQLLEAMDVHKEELIKMEIHKTHQENSEKQVPLQDRHPLMIAYNVTCPYRFMLIVLQRIKPSELDEALLLMPFNYALDFINILSYFLEKGWEVERSLQCLFFLLRVHCNQITANQNLLPVINKLRKTVVNQVNDIRDTIGFNLAGLQFLQSQIDANSEVQLFATAIDASKQKKKSRKRKYPLLLTH